VTTPFQGGFVIRGLRRAAMVSLHTTYKVSMFTHYENTKGNANVEIKVVWGGGT